MNILFLCTGNSCRSQLAEGWTRSLASGDVSARSAGIEAHGKNPRAIAYPLGGPENLRNAQETAQAIDAARAAEKVEQKKSGFGEMKQELAGFREALLPLLAASQQSAPARPNGGELTKAVAKNMPQHVPSAGTSAPAEADKGTPSPSTNTASASDTPAKSST